VTAPLAVSDIIQLVVPAVTTVGGVSLAGYLVHFFTKRRTTTCGNPASVGGR
jgi:hypothetical protein